VIEFVFFSIAAFASTVCVVIVAPVFPDHKVGKTDLGKSSTQRSNEGGERDRQVLLFAISGDYISPVDRLELTWCTVT
jgi:hypothetical protein